MVKNDSLDKSSCPSRDAVVSLFSGAGGMSYGFASAGLAPVLAADIDPDACATYATNLDSKVFNLDLSMPDDTFFQAIDHFRGAFALIGGPPCQGFSSAGVKNGKDARNYLIFSYLKIVERLRPRWFLFENVEGLLTSNGGHSVVQLVKEFINIGYRLRLEKVNFAAYGLPQARKRVILIGNSIGMDFALPLPTHSFDAGKHRSNRDLPPAPSFDEAVAGLGVAAHDDNTLVPYSTPRPLSAYDELMRYEWKGVLPADNNSAGVDCHAAGPLSNQLTNILAHLRPGQTMKNIPEELWHDSYRRRAFRRVMDGTPTERRGGAPSGIKRLRGHLNALTITSAATREFIHPSADRPLTLREAARLQSFPDRFHFAGSTTSIARQIGNAFPPLAAQVFAQHLTFLDRRALSDRHLRAPKRPGALIGLHLTNANGMSPALAKTSEMLERLVEGQPSFEFDLEMVTRSA